MRDKINEYTYYEMSHQFEEHSYFWSLKEIPKGAKPIKLLSNGSIVTGYYLNKDNIIHIFRPNPNAKSIYNPLTLEQHRQHILIYGLY